MKSRRIFLVLLLLCLAVHPAPASVALLMEEPWGEFGEFNPTGHAAVYLTHVCAESPTRLRVCREGELGSVISRYHKIHHQDWIAMPLIPYLYAVDEIRDVPQQVSKADVLRLRADYWHDHLQALAPAKKQGMPPAGEWVQLVGSSFDRRINGFQADTTPEQDQRFIALFNDRRNVGHFNLFFHNCADFSRVVLDTYFPHSVHRNIIADAGMMTPKQAAKSLVKYGKKHPELHMSAFVIPQVPGSMPRSIPINGVSESLVKSKKYLLPLLVLSPEFAGVALAQYLIGGASQLPTNAKAFRINDYEDGRSVGITLPGELPLAVSAPPDNVLPVTTAATN